MAYNEYEASTFSGRPIHLYEFTIDTKAWYVTSADSDISAGGRLYKTLGISDDGVNQTGEAQTDTFTLRVPITFDLVSLYVNTPPINDVTVKRARIHENDNELAYNYVGFIINVNFTTPGVAEITCQTLGPTMQRNGLRLTWQRGCPYVLYDPTTCKVDKNAHRLTTYVTNAQGGAVTVAADVAAFGDNYFTAGFVEWVDRRTGGPNRRGIKSQIGNTITLLGRSDGIANGDPIFIYPGCQRVAQVCSSKFNNMANYGGEPHIPGKSPFSGDPVF